MRHSATHTATVCAAECERPASDRKGVHEHRAARNREGTGRKSNIRVADQTRDGLTGGGRDGPYGDSCCRKRGSDANGVRRYGTPLLQFVAVVH